jgi:hypothetical protein
MAEFVTDEDFRTPPLDLSGGKQLWLIRAPKDLDPAMLQGLTMEIPTDDTAPGQSLGEIQLPASSEGGEARRIVLRLGDLSESSSIRPLFTADPDKGPELKVGPAFSRHMNISVDVAPPGATAPPAGSALARAMAGNPDTYARRPQLQGLTIKQPKWDRSFGSSAEATDAAVATAAEDAVAAGPKSRKRARSEPNAAAQSGEKPSGGGGDGGGSSSSSSGSAEKAAKKKKKKAAAEQAEKSPPKIDEQEKKKKKKEKKKDKKEEMVAATDGSSSNKKRPGSSEVSDKQEKKKQKKEKKEKGAVSPPPAPPAAVAAGEPKSDKKEKKKKKKKSKGE